MLNMLILIDKSAASLMLMHGAYRGARCDAGALLFLVLTGATLWARPAPLALGVDALHALEQRLSAAGRGGLLVRSHSTAPCTLLPDPVCWTYQQIFAVEARQWRTSSQDCGCCGVGAAHLFF